MENFPKLKQRFALKQVWLQSASNSTLRWAEAIIVSPCFSRDIVEKPQALHHAEDWAVRKSKRGSGHHEFWRWMSLILLPWFQTLLQNVQTNDKEHNQSSARAKNRLDWISARTLLGAEKGCGAFQNLLSRVLQRHLASTLTVHKNRKSRSSYSLDSIFTCKW